jgi:hypothetical protein
MTAAAMIFSPISVCSFPRSIKILTRTGKRGDRDAQADENDAHVVEAEGKSEKRSQD